MISKLHSLFEAITVSMARMAKMTTEFLILMSFHPNEIVWKAALDQHCSGRATAEIPVLSLRCSTIPLRIFGVR